MVQCNCKVIARRISKEKAGRKQQKKNWQKILKKFYTFFCFFSLLLKSWNREEFHEILPENVILFIVLLLIGMEQVVAPI